MIENNYHNFQSVSVECLYGEDTTVFEDHNQNHMCGHRFHKLALKS